MKTKIVYGARGIKLFYIDGKEVSEVEFRKAGNRFRIADFLGAPPGGTQTDTWPKTCISMACHPDSVGEYNAAMKEHGIGAVYDNSGMPHCPDRAAHKRMMRFFKYHDKDAFS